MKILVLVIGIITNISSYAFASGIVTVCSGRNGQTSYVIKIFADSNSEGGYRFTDNYYGDYPTKSTEIGTTRVISDNENKLSVELTEKAFELSEIPLFNSNNGKKNIEIDLSDTKNIKANFLGAVLTCRSGE